MSAVRANNRMMHTIMIVDDNPTNLHILIRILEGTGHRILVAKSGPAAIAIARKQPPDLILLDVQMPDMDGFEVLRLLKADPTLRDVIVVFLSAHGDVTDKVAGLELGASDYITKPFQTEEVMARVSGHLHRRDLERQLRISNELLARELRNAGEMQRTLLPTVMPVDERITFSAYYRTSLQAGGDYYDVIPLGDGKFAVIVADVAGHGAGAAIVMAMIRTMIHAFPGSLDNPEEVLLTLNNHFTYLTRSGLFATAVYAVIDSATRRMRISRAGHPTPLLLRRGACDLQWQSEGTVPLFVEPLTSVPVVTHQLEPGDRLVFYTDGVTDVVNPEGTRFELNKLVKVLCRHLFIGAPEQLAMLVSELEAFAVHYEPSDDVTLLLVALD